MKKEKIAIIGAGVSGLSAAYFLHEKYNVTLLEKENRFGGHAYTYKINNSEDCLDLDLGFMVFNELTYPNFINLLKELKIEYEKSCMSFAVSRKNFEYAGSNLSSLFPSFKNFYNAGFLRMLYEIARFNNVTKKIILKEEYSKQANLKKFLDDNSFSDFFQQNYILPMAAAIWSCDMEAICQFDLISFLKFFQNHGLIQIFNRPQWYTLKEMSQSYISEILKKKFKKKSAVDISQVHSKIKTILYKDGSSEKFDKIIFATPANQTVKLAKDLEAKYKNYLNKFSYTRNIAYLHTDHSLMPKNRKVWASWCSVERNNKFFITYWLNNIQNLNTKNNYFLSLNPDKINSKHILKKITFHHPCFNQQAVKAQANIKLIQGHRDIFYCGSYLGYGFHEDGLSSAIDICKQLGVTTPWS